MQKDHKELKRKLKYRFKEWRKNLYIKMQYAFNIQPIYKNLNETNKNRR